MTRKGQSLRQKILRAFVAVCMVSLVISGVISAVGMLGLRDAAANGNSAIGAQAAETGGSALLEQALRDVSTLSASKSEVIDGELQKTFDSLLMLSGYLSGIYKYPENYTLLPFNHCRFNSGGKREMQWMLSPGMAESTGTRADLERAGVLEETFLQGNMQTLYEIVMTQNASVSSIYTTSATGVNTGYDDKSPDKVTGSVATDVADLRGTQWYTGARESGGVYVTDTYRDSYGRGLCITVSTPYYNRDGGFAGVIGLDMLISDVSQNVLQSTVGGTGYAVLLNVNAQGGAKIIAAPGMDETNESDIGMFLGKRWQAVLADISAGRQGAQASTLNSGESVYVCWAPVTATGWTFAFVMPGAEITAPSVQIRDVIGKMTNDVTSETRRQIALTVGIFIAVMMAVLALTALVAARVARRISDPILSLAESVRAIGDGDLDDTSAIKTGDEIEDLSLSFQRMTTDLKAYIANLANVTAEKERIGAELDVATKIQASMLPSIFPAFPERAEFDIYASMQPAKEVGGDFYDFFLIDEKTLAVVMADVSGKGVPAALFMVIAKTLIKNNAQYGMTPAEVFVTVNNLLCENNEVGMFVTAFMGYLDIPSGTFTFVNAGHNPPLLKAGERWEWLKAKRGFILAGMENIRYTQTEITLKRGDRLFLYTDGVTEAMNNDKRLFSDQRLLEAANGRSEQDLKGFTLSIKREIDAFAEGAEQADDITMLALRYKGAV